MSRSNRSPNGLTSAPNGKLLGWASIVIVAAGLVVSLDRNLGAAAETSDTMLLVRIGELSRTIDALTSRVAALEAEAAKHEAAPAQGNQRVTAPFEVVDKSGNAILSVSDGTYDATARGRVHIGRGTGDNFGIWVRGADGASAVVIREQASGVGGVYVMDKKGIGRVALSAEDDGGVTVLNAASKEIASLGADPKAKAAGMLRVNNASGTATLNVAEGDRHVSGPFAVTDKAGKPIMSVSDAPMDAEPNKGRIHLGRGSGNNYALWIRKADGGLAASLGETKDGVGLAAVYDKSGKARADLWGANGINVYDQTGAKQLVAIAPNDAGQKVKMTLTGSAHLVNAAGKVMFEAGESNEGGGLAHVYGTDGTVRTELNKDGLIVVSPAGKHVVSLELNPSSTGSVVGVRGQLQVFDANGGATVEMGTAGSGVGVVRVGPNFQCGPTAPPLVAGVPTCMVGKK